MPEAPAAAPAVQPGPKGPSNEKAGGTPPAGVQGVKAPSPALPGVQPKPQESAKPAEVVAEPAKAAEPAPEVKERQRKAAMIAQAARAEAAVRKREDDLKSREAKFEQERKNWDQQNAASLSKAQELDRFAGLAKTPLKFLEAAGIKKETILEEMVKGDTRTPEEIANAIFDRKMAEERGRQAAEQKKAQDDAVQRQAAETARVKAQHVKDIKAAVKANPERYETCQIRPDVAELAYEYIEANYYATAKQGRAELMPIEVALDHVEAELYDGLKKHTASSRKLAAEKEAAEAASKKASDEAAAAEAAKVRPQRRDFYTERQPREPKPTVVQPQPALNPFSVRGRREAIRQIDEQIAKTRE